MENLVVFLLVGLVAGFLASKVMTGRGMGLIWDIVVGVLGAFLGGWLVGALGIAVGGLLAEIVVAFIGALILLFIFRALIGRGMIRA
ncbi:MAG: GlsB/YeaQ/YmgE family stress response membrane protein [Chloroflexi bacterium]|nr:MAG: GlsB/YeaQ/YmgE family stress response membrane protein [Chloroflexota bacterium]TME56878.1 MAG: GlsB/YeaQ/YmgE family stress response membrane protein [Chloroflexota bacterium]